MRHSTAADRATFIHELAVFLAGNQAMKSIALEMKKEWAQEWARVRSTTPLFGYPTVEEAEEMLTAFLAPPLTHDHVFVPGPVPGKCWHDGPRCEEPPERHERHEEEAP